MLIVVKVIMMKIIVVKVGRRMWESEIIVVERGDGREG